MKFQINHQTSSFKFPKQTQSDVTKESSFVQNYTDKGFRLQ